MALTQKKDISSCMQFIRVGNDLFLHTYLAVLFSNHFLLRMAQINEYALLHL